MYVMYIIGAAFCVTSSVIILYIASLHSIQLYCIYVSEETECNYQTVYLIISFLGEEGNSVLSIKVQ